jgi:hypothetical protein
VYLANHSDLMLLFHLSGMCGWIMPNTQGIPVIQVTFNQEHLAFKHERRKFIYERVAPDGYFSNMFAKNISLFVHAPVVDSG